VSLHRSFWVTVCAIVCLAVGGPSVYASRAVAPFDMAVVVETGLGAQADEQIAAALTSEVQKLIYLTAPQRQALVEQTPTHQLQVRYTGRTRTGAVQEHPAAREGSPSRFTIEYASRGRLECTLVARQGETTQVVQRWEGTFQDAETLSLGRSQGDAAQLRKTARQVIIARLTVQLAEAARGSSAERFWPIRVENIAPDANGTVTGRFILTNQSPWPMAFTPEVRGEVINPDKIKPDRWYYLYNYPKKRLGTIVLQPGETVEHSFELAMSTATPEQVASGRIIETTFRDFTFKATIWRAKWQPTGDATDKLDTAVTEQTNRPKDDAAETKDIDATSRSDTGSRS